MPGTSGLHPYQRVNAPWLACVSAEKSREAVLGERDMLKEFKEFAMRGSVVDLAVVTRLSLRLLELERLLAEERAARVSDARRRDTVPRRRRA